MNKITVKRIGIIGAMKLEVEQLISHMTIDDKQEVAGNIYYSGSLHNQDIVVTCGGVGKVNAASSTQILISHFEVDAIINTGIAGGMQPNVKVCDIVISTDVTHHDVRKNQMISCFPHQAFFVSDERLIELAEKTIRSSSFQSNYHIGRIVSGESFISDPAIKNLIIEAYEPHCVEMEGAAIGQVSYLNNIPFVVIRCISDNADDEATMSYETFETIAANQSSKLVMDMMKNLKYEGV